MPELPEVETIVRDLRRHLPGRRIERVELTQRRVLRTRPQKLARALEGATVDSVERWGKHIVMRVTNGAPLWWTIHLGMTGRLTIEPVSRKRARHTHAVFVLDSGDQELRYTDLRQFGRIQVERRRPACLDALGPEPLEISESDFVSALRARRARLKALLLDQRFLRGVGNIYADESLFRAGLHPVALGAKISRARAAALHRHLREVLTEAIESRGSSVRDYVDGRGEAGRFQFEHRVYGRWGEPCVVCGTKLSRTLVASRTTTFCRRCQKR